MSLNNTDIQAPAEDVPVYPPETARHMSWQTIKFINSPTSYMLDLTCMIIFATFVTSLILAQFLHLDVSVRGTAEVSVEGGVRELVSPIDGVVTKVLKKNGDAVKEHDLIARLQLDEDASNEFEAVAKVISDLTVKVDSIGSPLDLVLVSPVIVRTYRIYDPTLLQALANVEHSVHDFQLQRIQALQVNHKRNLEDPRSGGAGSEVYFASKRIEFLTNRLNKMKASSHRELLATYIDSTEEELGRLKTQVSNAKLKVTSALDLSYADLLRTLRIATGVINDFRQHHEVRAPIDGVIGKIIEGDSIHLTLNKPVATIIPANSHFIAKIKMKSQDVVRLKKGQRVFYKLEAYPFQRFGLFSGEITDLEQVRDSTPEGKPALDEIYTATATILPPEKIKESLKKQIKFIYGMRGEGSVVLDRKSINDIMLDKLFNMKEL